MKTPVPREGDYVRVADGDGNGWAGTVVWCDEENATVHIEDPGITKAILGTGISIPLALLEVIPRPPDLTWREFLGLPLAGTPLDRLKTPLSVAIVIEGLDTDGMVCQWRLRSADTTPSHALGLHEIAAARYLDRNDR